MSEEVNKGGRPPMPFSQEIADLICEQIVDGKSLKQILRAEAGKMIGMNTFFKWIREHESFAKQYAKAKNDQADTLVDEILDIADNAHNDWMESNSPDNPGWRFNGEAVRRSQMRIDARKWLAGKMRPKKYGDKYINEISGPEGTPLKVQAIAWEVVDPATETPSGGTSIAKDTPNPPAPEEAT